MKAWALDDFAAKYDWLAVDTEGSDALVLEGAGRLLLERRVALLEFEFNRMGFWAVDSEAPRTLTRTLQVLESVGYSCFWQGAVGLAPRATSPCVSYL